MNNEFQHWYNYFQTEDFDKRLNELSKKCKGKKVIFYCNGIFFEALERAVNLSQYFNIAGISDIRYETEKKGAIFNCIPPSKLKNTKFDYIIITSPNPNLIIKYFEQNKLCTKNKIIPLIFNKKKKDFKIVLEYFNQTKNLIKSLKYFIFCSSEELKVKINYEKKIKELKTKDKIKVLFVCEENSKWGYQFVYEKLKKDSHFEVLPIVLYPIITKSRVEFTQKENKTFFDSLGINTIDGYNYDENCNKDLKDFNPDIVFYQQPWYLQGNNHPSKVSEFALTVMIPYGYTTLSEKEWGSESVKNVYCNLWKFFSESKYHNKFYKKSAKMNGKDILLATGTPKLDYYFVPYKKNFWKGENIKKKIIWAPHHSIGKEGLRMSTFKENYKYFLELAKKHQEYSFIIKPHPALKNACISSGFMTEKDFDNYMDEWDNLPNAYVYNQGGFFDIFKTSDLLITDCSSFLAEYFPTKKPIIFLNRPDRAEFDKFGKKLKKGFYECNNNEELDKTIIKILVEEQDNLYKLRCILNEKLFNKESATEKILEFIKQSF